MSDKPTQQMFVEDEEKTPVEKKTKPKAKKEKYTPTESVESVPAENHNVLPLPSKGLLWYPDTVEYRSMMVKDEETLSLATSDSYAKTLNGVIKAVLNDCPFFEQMTVFDRDYVLIWLWANNYDVVKTVNVICQHCEHEEPKKVDLTKFPATDIKENIPVPFTIPLKGASVSRVDVRLNTVGDELEVESYLRNHQNASFEHLMMAASVDLGVKMPFDKKVDWVRNNISSKELGIIKNFHRYFKYGVNEEIEHICSECEGVTRGPLPFQTEDVLFPTLHTDFEQYLFDMQSDEDPTE